jgi:hypothetical protein
MSTARAGPSSRGYIEARSEDEHGTGRPLLAGVHRSEEGGARSEDYDPPMTMAPVCPESEIEQINASVPVA